MASINSTRFAWVLILSIVVFLATGDSLRFGSWWWPKTTGKIDKLDPHSLRSVGGGKYSWYRQKPCLEIYYHFRVDGNDYKDTDQLDIAPEAEILKQSKVYPPGSSIEVYYNPKNPKQSMLFPAQRLRVVLVLGVVTAIALVFTLCQCFRRKPLS